MKIGLRTIKTAVASVLAMALASALNLQYATAAGVIAILSLGNTKKDSLLTGLGRVGSLAIATVIAFGCFSLLGYHPLAFGVYLLVFIPVVVRWRLTDGIVVNSVLVTHYLLEKSFAWPLIANEFLLMIIGVGFALLLNSYMPNRLQQLKAEQQVVEDMFRKTLWDFAKYLNQSDVQVLERYCEGLMQKIHAAQQKAKLVQEDRFLERDPYYERYFLMRASQVRILQDMLELQKDIQVEETLVAEIKQLLQDSAQTFDEANDGAYLLAKIATIYAYYQEQPLPQNRIEFENRARLFQYLQSFRTFIEMKAEFMQSDRHLQTETS